MESFLQVWEFIFAEGHPNTKDFRLVLQSEREWDQEKRAFGMMWTFSIWCMNPAVTYEQLHEKAHSLILTSGTLSPMSSFTAEVRFPRCSVALPRRRMDYDIHI